MWEFVAVVVSVSPFFLCERYERQTVFLSMAGFYLLVAIAFPWLPPELGRCLIAVCAGQLVYAFFSFLITLLVCIPVGATLDSGLGERTAIRPEVVRKSILVGNCLATIGFWFCSSTSFGASDLVRGLFIFAYVAESAAAFRQNISDGNSDDYVMNLVLDFLEIPFSFFLIFGVMILVEKIQSFVAFPTINHFQPDGFLDSPVVVYFVIWRSYFAAVEFRKDLTLIPKLSPVVASIAVVYVAYSLQLKHADEERLAKSSPTYQSKRAPSNASANKLGH